MIGKKNREKEGWGRKKEQKVGMAKNIKELQKSGKSSWLCPKKSKD